MDVQTIVIGAIAVIVGAVKILDFFGYLPRKKSVVDGAAELSIAEKTIARLKRERDTERSRAEKLAQERTNEPVIALLHEIAAQLAENVKAQTEGARAQAEVMDRLASHNGSFAHMKDGMGELIESMRTLTGLIAELHDLPMQGRDT